MSLDNFEIGKLLGKGSFGSVIIVIRKIDRHVYAMKRVNLSHSPKVEIEAALNEIRLLASLNHPNIIGYKETFYDNSSHTLNIVMEFADDGDLAKKIDYNKKHRCRFDENLIWEWIFQLLYGLEYLHGHHIMHRDLKSANVFLMKNGVLKIGDLNVSKLSKSNFQRTKTGTPYYLAPEVWEDRPYDYKCDIWSLGCIIYELCTLVPPFRGTSLKKLYDNIKACQYQKISDEYSEDLKQLIKWMLIVNPNKRLSAAELLNSNLVKNRIKNNSRRDIIEKISKSKKNYNLIGTIKMPRNLKDINRVLPHERYQMGENDPFETMKKTIKIMSNNNQDNSNNIKMQPLNNYNRELANQRKLNQNNLPNENIQNIKPVIIADKENNNKKEYGIFNNNINNNKYYNNNPNVYMNNNKLDNNHNFINNNNNQEQKNMNEIDIQNKAKISVKEIKMNDNNSNKITPKVVQQNQNHQNVNTNSTQKRKEQKEKFNQIKNQFDLRPQSKRGPKNQNAQKNQKQNELKHKRLASGQPRNNNNNNNLLIQNNKNKNYNNINNNHAKLNNPNMNQKRPVSHCNNRIQVKNINNNNFPKRNIIKNNPIRKYEINNHNYNYLGQNFDMNPYKREIKANYGKLDANNYKRNNKAKFNEYLRNGGRVNYNNENNRQQQINAHRQRINPSKQNNNFRKGKY